MCEGQVQPGSAADAIAAVRAGLAYLTAAAAGLTAAEQAECLRGLAAAEAQHVAATAAVVSAFDAGAGPAGDGQATARAWLRWQTRVTGAAAGSAVKWSRRLRAHPEVGSALAAGRLSVSWARELCDWSDALPEEHRAGADQVLVGAAGAGAGLDDLRGLAEDIRRRTARPDRDVDADGFEGRWVRLTPHYQGHARLDGELTPQAAAAVRAVLDALGKPAGPEDDRTRGQREHDALEEACRRLVAGGLPDRAGQPTQIMLTMTLRDLLDLPGAGTTLSAWDASGAPAPPGADCDAAIQPIVTGHLDQSALDAASPGAGALGQGPAGCRECAARRDSPAGTVAGPADLGQRAAAQLAIARAARILSGPGGLASWLRTSQLSGPAATISLPLDVGAVTETIPAHLRRAIIRRDQHCRFPGCAQPPAACHVHHLIPRSEGGTTSLDNCGLFCTFHHLIAIHRWGWQVTLNPDGTTTATSARGDRVLHSHAVPLRAA
jgi:Domain of unknown function (DUF222)/HNH endonuclease